MSERPSLRILRPLAEPAALIEAQNRARAFVKEVLRDGTDYGTIPGTEGKALLKPGAEKITAGFGCVAVPRILEQEVDHFRDVPWRKRRKEWTTGEGGRREQVWVEQEGRSLGLYRFVVAVDIVDQDGTVRGTGLGSCSTLESKYCDRPRECENTTLKMARKRAHVAAVLDAFGLSDEFDDIAEEEATAAGAEPGAAPGMARGSTERLFVMPFGSNKGMALSDIETRDLKSALEWNVKTCPGKYADFQREAKAEITRRSARAPEPTPESQFEAPLPPPPADELPF
ncbi:MAG: hypothetical protein HYV19_04295 [Gemmatimonadetes bacterium]|nr:hypothetical protein [Gemmatimonadota bacterium]